VATPWVTPRAVAVTLEQLPACADCGARLKATIAQTATAAISDLLMSPLLFIIAVQLYQNHWLSSFSWLVKVICVVTKIAAYAVYISA
jgi:hypothetical protein